MCALETGVQTCALPIYGEGSAQKPRHRDIQPVNGHVVARQPERQGDVGAEGEEVVGRETPHLEPADRGYLRGKGRDRRLALPARNGCRIVSGQKPEGDRDPTERQRPDLRSEEHTSELQSLMRISYAV